MRTPKGRGICVSCGREATIAVKSRSICFPCYAKERYPLKEVVACSRCGRKQPKYARGLCRGCYNAVRVGRTLFGSPEFVARKRLQKQPQGPLAINYRGGRTIDDKGYVRVLAPPGYRGRVMSTGYVFEHRLVMEKKLGRLLGRRENVHHLNGNPQDNRPENLEVFATWADHMMAHRSLAS